MGHSKVSKANTHARVVRVAASRFKEQGIDGIGVADLMKQLDLTHGGFYKHFASRDALVAEAMDLALTDSGTAMRERLFDGGRPDLAGFVNFYLDDAHRGARGEGCAVAALAGDAARKGSAVQAQFRAQIDHNLEALSAALKCSAGTHATAAGSRAAAVVLLSTLYGALIMARAVGDSPLSDEILRTVRKRMLTPDKAARTPSAGVGRGGARARAARATGTRGRAGGLAGAQAGGGKGARSVRAKATVDA